MVELVDTLDLKSNDYYDRAGSSPAPGTFFHIKRIAQIENFGALGRYPFLKVFCENSSVGRARPCQGRGREFESRFSLTKKALHFHEVLFL